MKKQVKQTRLKLEKFKVAKINNSGKRRILGGGDGNGGNVTGVAENEKDDIITTSFQDYSKYC